MKKFLPDRLTIIDPRLKMRIFFLLTVLFIFCSCSYNDPPRFKKLSPEKTGITFSNDLKNTSDFNILDYLYFYDGGGVSVGDINNDGLPDIYFTANMKSNKLYLNKSNFRFEDITSQAGVAGTGDWTTGTTMADVNGDGWLDIYVCNVNYLTKEGRNQLFINNGDSTFTEQAAKYGLDFQGYSKQAAFFDYDNDGDLDMYLLNHSVHSSETYVEAERREGTDPNAGDRLYRNDGDMFTDVTQEAGIYSSALGYGLAVGVSDLNWDGCQDLYISNDFHENDYLYINNCDDSFTEVLEHAAGHTSRSSMGNDIADMNNDGLTDIFVADMLPVDEEGLKTAVSSESYKVYQIQRQFGYHPQLIKNTLQLNLGEGPDGQLHFAEIAQFAGVNATDWSWAALFFDMDNSGRKDLFVTNGIYRRPNDLDYLLYVKQEETQQVLKEEENQIYAEVIEKMPHTKIPNAGFINQGDYRFSDQSHSLGFTEPGYSNGAAYGDLDNDGDLDLVINNVNTPASVLKNMTRERGGGNYLKVELQGEGKNTTGIGGKVMVYDSSSVQLYELFTTRGFLSSVEAGLTIGLGEQSRVDSVAVIWPDHRYQTLYNIKANQQLVLRQSEANGSYHYRRRKETEATPVFNNVTSGVSVDYSHKEDSFLDFNHQQLAPFMLSSQGPCLAAGDVNNDGLEDFFVCGAKWQPGALFLQQSGGSFKKKEIAILEQDAPYEDVDAALFDANGDGTLDLYVVSGGNEYSYQSTGLGDRLYLNDGEGNFVRISNSLPPVYENGAIVAVADYDGDGDQDLFTGSRSVPRNYGITPNSYLYENTGNGQFKDVTDQVATGLRQIGMVTDARWNDFDGDGAPDLIVAGEWMPIRLFLNKGGKLVESTSDAGLEETHGWWQSVETGDFDRDGDIDFVAGNMGTNSFLKASKNEPIVLYLKDFNEDGQIDPIIGYTKNGKEYPVAPRDELLTQFKFLRSEFNSYNDYAGETIPDIFGETLMEGTWEKKEVYTLHSVYAENTGNGSFNITPLPDKVQWAPVFAFLAGDYNGDGLPDLLAGGNFHEVKPSLGGRYDASYGWHLKGRGDGKFEVTENRRSGFFVEGEIRDMVQLTGPDGQELILVARNNQPLLFFNPARKSN